MSARADLCGGRSAMIVPTATSSSVAGRQIFVSHNPGRITAHPDLPQNGCNVRVGDDPPRTHINAGAKATKPDKSQARCPRGIATLR